MLDIGFMELLLISIVALLVLGPEKLPQAVRTAALWIGRARRSFNKVRAEIEREINADDIRRQLHNESILADLDEAKEKASRLTRDTKESFSKLEKDVRHGLDGETKEDRSSASDGKNREKESATGTDAAADEAAPDAPPSEPASQEEPRNESDEAGPPEESGQPAEGTEKTEKEKPVTDFYNNPPDKVVTVQGRKFKAGKEDDDRA